MKHTILLTFLSTFLIASVHAQKISAYAITASEKGHSGWSEVKLVDITTGEEIKTIYRNTDKVNVLNARTGQPAVKKEVTYNKAVSNAQGGKEGLNELMPVRREIPIMRSDMNANKDVHIQRDMHKMIDRRIMNRVSTVQSEKPFATNSAACAYDKKHDRLYYTPLGINQLRYIDLKSQTPTIYYFEDDTFGALNSRFDVPNQITRMVIGSDGNGYALSNNGNHLIKFTTNKKAVITDLGALADDPANGNYSIHNAHGGDMIAGDRGNFYVITANKSVFKFDADTKVATYLGSIKGLPKGYSTNGAIVEKGTTVIVSSANSTLGYFKFDLATLTAEQIANNGSVFNASDLANGTLVTDKKLKKDKQTETKVEEPAVAQTNKKGLFDILNKNNIAVYPNPVAIGGIVKLAFADQPKGRYTIQLLDISGRLLDSKPVSINNKNQLEEFKLPSTLVGKGTYLIKIISDLRKPVSVNTILIQ
jgi:hypothetical protein